MSQPNGPAVGSAQSGQGPVLDTKLGWSRLHADQQMISYGRKSIALADVEWVSYRAVHTATKRFLYPTTHDGQWFFEVGRYPYRGAAVAVNDFRAGRRTDPPEYWTFLVNLAQQYLEPRLLTGLVEQIRRGETVLVGGALRVNQDGISCIKPNFSPALARLRRRPGKQRRGLDLPGRRRQTPDGCLPGQPQRGADTRARRHPHVVTGGRTRVSVARRSASQAATVFAVNRSVEYSQ